MPIGVHGARNRQKSPSTMRSGNMCKIVSQAS
jgi:hypothetical protein